MSDDRQTQQTHEPAGDEEIVPAPRTEDPGARDGVGEHVVRGLGDEGVRRMDGEFADLEDARSTSDADAPDGASDPSTREG